MQQCIVIIIQGAIVYVATTCLRKKPVLSATATTSFIKTAIVNMRQHSPVVGALAWWSQGPRFNAWPVVSVTVAVVSLSKELYSHCSRLQFTHSCINGDLAPAAVVLSHWYSNDFGDLSHRSSTCFGETSPVRGYRKKQTMCQVRRHSR